MFLFLLKFIFMLCLNSITLRFTLWLMNDLSFTITTLVRFRCDGVLQVYFSSTAQEVKTRNSVSWLRQPMSLAQKSGSVQGTMAKTCARMDWLSQATTRDQSLLICLEPLAGLSLPLARHWLAGEWGLHAKTLTK